MKKNSALSINIFLLFILFQNASAFYEAIQCNIYVPNCNKICNFPEMHEVYKNTCNRLFKIWTGLDLMQSIQTAMPEGNIETYMLLADAISVLYELKQHDSEKFREHPEDLKIMHSIIKNLSNHSVVAHLQPLKKVIELCNDAVIHFDQSLNQKSDVSHIMIL